MASNPVARVAALISYEELVPGAQEQRGAFQVGPVAGSGKRIDPQVSGGNCVPPALGPLCISAQVSPWGKGGLSKGLRGDRRMIVSPDGVVSVCALGCACVRAGGGPGCSGFPSGLCFLGAKAIRRPFAGALPASFPEWTGTSDQPEESRRSRGLR